MWSRASIIDRVPPLLPPDTGRSAPIPSSTTVRRKAKATRGAATPKDKTAAATARPAQARQARGRPSMEEKLADLEQRLLEISVLSGAGAVLGWDQATYMPKGGATARARQGATLSRLAHERLVDPALGKLLDDLAPY